MKERLNKYLARRGVASRRRADAMTASGRIKVNGETVKDGVFFVDPDKDQVECDGRIIGKPEDMVYYALYKPVGYTSTVRDPNAKNVVVDLVPDSHRVFPVGRLDKESEGLMILTNDGDLALELTHPSFEHEKEYLVTITTTQADQKDQLLERVKALRNRYASNRILITTIKKDPGIFTLRIILKEGKKRQIRRMCRSMGLNVTQLKRIRIGRLKLGELKPGEFRKIKKSQILE